MASPEVHTIIAGPQRAPDTLTRLAAAWVRAGLIAPATDCEAERRTLAAVAILSELHDKAGVRNRDHLIQLFNRLTAGELPLIDALIADARDGSPVLVLTHWGTEGGRSATSFVFKLTADLESPICAPDDDWEPLLEGVLSLVPLLDTFVESSVVPFKREAR